MKIILSPECTSLTGALDSHTGYSIQRRADGFYSQRSSRGHVPPDGHWRFIVLCAEMAERRTFISDIRVSYLELITALHEAGLHREATQVTWPTYDAPAILTFKNKYRL